MDAGLLRAWVAIHATRSALVILTLTAVASTLMVDAKVSSIGFVRFLGPISVPVLFPVLAGSAVGIATHNQVDVPLPAPWRCRIARLGWLAAVTGVAVFAASAGRLLRGGDVTVPVLARNVLVCAAIAVTSVALGSVNFAWLPPFGYAFSCMFFGFPPAEPRFYWWAVLLQEQVTRAQCVVVGMMFTGAAITYSLGARGSATLHASI